MSSGGSSLSNSSSSEVGGMSSGIGCGLGLHVAAEGIEGPERAGWVTRPSVAKTVSASSATVAMALARSSLNCLRSALRLAVISSEVNSKAIEIKNEYR